jgi:hypothetical protein
MNTPKTGDRRTFPLSLPDLEPCGDVQFIFVEGVGFAADRTVHLGISYDDIAERGYDTGREITVGDERFLCRMVTSAEWDDCMDWDDSDDVWHWCNAFLWAYSDGSLCAVRGGCSAHFCGINPASIRIPCRGWRPCLVALPSAAPDTGEGMA